LRVPLAKPVAERTVLASRGIRVPTGRAVTVGRWAGRHSVTRVVQQVTPPIAECSTLVGVPRQRCGLPLIGHVVVTRWRRRVSKRWNSANPKRMLAKHTRFGVARSSSSGSKVLQSAELHTVQFRGVKTSMTGSDAGSRVRMRRGWYPKHFNSGSHAGNAELTTTHGFRTLLVAMRRVPVVRYGRVGRSAVESRAALRGSNVSIADRRSSYI
jgi:hypothetical protein